MRVVAIATVALGFVGGVATAGAIVIPIALLLDHGPPPGERQGAYARATISFVVAVVANVATFAVLQRLWRREEPLMEVSPRIWIFGILAAWFLSALTIGYALTIMPMPAN